MFSRCFGKTRAGKVQHDKDLEIADLRRQIAVLKQSLEVGQRFNEPAHQPDSQTVQNALEKAANFLKHNETSHIDIVFENNADTHGRLNTSGFSKALMEVGVTCTENDARTLFSTVDLDQDGFLSLGDFKQALRYQTEGVKWLASLPVVELIAEFLSPDISLNLQRVLAITPDQLHFAIQSLSPALELLISDGMEKLKKCYAELEKNQTSGNNKYQLGLMKGGNISDFLEGGITSRVGKLI